MKSPLSQKNSQPFKETNPHSAFTPIPADIKQKTKFDVMGEFSNHSIPSIKLDSLDGVVFNNLDAVPDTKQAVFGNLVAANNALKFASNDSVGTVLVPTYTPVMQKTFHFMSSNVIASQTENVIDVLGLAGNTQYTMMYSGSIIAISVASNAARTGGTLTVQPYFAYPGGSTIISELSATLDGTNTSYHYDTREAPFINTFVAGWVLGVVITTSADWTPTTADIVVTVITT